MPLKAWIKSALDHAIQVCLGEPDLEFTWVGDDAVDPLQQAQRVEVARAGPHGEILRRHSLEIVVEDVGPRGDHHFERAGLA